MSKSFLTACLVVLHICALSQTISIADARLLPEDTEVTVSGTVTNGSELGIIRYFQDETAGIAAYGSQVNGIQRGDSITVTGILTEYNGLLELSPISSITNHGAATIEIEPATIDISELNENSEGELVTINQVSFTQAGSNFVGNTSYNFVSAGGDASIYVRTGHPLVGQIIPTGSINLTGLVSQFTFTGFGGYQLILRDGNDVSNPNPISIISAIEQSQQTSTGFHLSWDTDVESSTEAFYTNDITGNGLEENHIIGDGDNTDQHILEFENLTPGEVYFIKVFSVLEEDTAFSNTAAYATVSPFGNMEVYFNNSVNTAEATPESNVAIQTNLKDTIISYIDRANSTLDLAIYNTNNTEIVAALNEAYDRGVQIRYIAEGDNANSALSSLISDIPIFLRQNSEGSGMHNKFIVVDYEDNDSSYVLTGSTNFTNNNLSTDPNNLVIIQDKALAKSYRIEFNEMWGSNTMTPDPINSKFGEFKRNNTPEKFIIDGKNVELYFSPGNATNPAIAEALNSADASIDFALLLLTENSLADIIIEKSQNPFITVNGIINDINTTGSDFDEMVDEGVNVLEHSSLTSLHHKYGIVDHADFNSDPLVITGSHNWTASADDVNDENTLIIHDATIANLFYQEFTARYNEATLSTDEQAQAEIKLYPNPATDWVNLEFEGLGDAATITVYSLEGKLIQQLNIRSYKGANGLTLDVSSLPVGFYLLEYKEGNRKGVQKLSISK